MKLLARKEKIQRGCLYCVYVMGIKTSRDIRSFCPYEECPYRVLDKYKTYEDFIESDESKIDALTR